MATPFRTPPGDLMEVSTNLSPENIGWVHNLAAAHDATLSAAVMQVLEDSRAWWSLPRETVKALVADAKALGLSQRDYIYYLLRERVRELHGKT